MSFLVVLNQGREVWIHLFALEKQASCTYQKVERFEEIEIQEWIEASILIIGNVTPTQNLQELSWYLKYGRIILTDIFCKKMDWKHTYHDLVATR
jgi:hypothetical protein